jgi:O-antigen ligase/Flp pilus assembly protein TadD
VIAYRLDGLLTAGVVLLLVFTPLAFGSVHPWAFSLMEAVIFSLVIVWMAKIALCTRNGEWQAAVPLSNLRYFAAPIALLLGLILFQLTPLPPRLMRVLSPSTYQLYTRTLPGWPNKEPYANALRTSSGTGETSAQPPFAILPTLTEAQHGAHIPFASLDGGVENEKTSDSRVPAADNGQRKGVSTALPVREATWYPLSIAPSLTCTGFLKALAYASLFVLILGYPFGDGSLGEARFYRVVLGTLLVVGFSLAIIGIAERVYWNGKILWFFIPKDLGAAHVGSLPRATGPFVDPDHFANYLAMIFPLSLAAALFPGLFAPKRAPQAFRLVCGVGAFLIFSAIVLSLSRAGWVAAGLGALVLGVRGSRPTHLSVRRGGENKMPHRRGVHRRGMSDGVRPKKETGGLPRSWLSGRSPLRLYLVGLLALVVLALFFVGPQGRMQADVRLGETVAEGGAFGVRPSVWKNTLRMIGDFPVLGVGLGSWPEIFPHYERGPWFPDYFREAHNDYLQFMAETGLIGLLALVWFFGRVAAKLFAARNRLSGQEWPVFAALGLALGVMAFHELVDFPLHIPANALLFTLLLALAVRMAAAKLDGNIKVVVHPRRIMVATRCVAAGALIAIAAAVAQKGLAYPYDIPPPTSLAEARALVLAHPASSQAHLSLIALAGGRMAPALRLKEIAAAVWLDPADPYARDLYARSLAQGGEKEKALVQIRKSVFNSPTLGSHAYLDGRLIRWLSLPERSAVEQGFKDAIAAHYPGARASLAAFYTVLGRLSKGALLYAGAARDAQSAGARAQYLIVAAETEVRAGNKHSAATLFRRAIQVTPSDPRPYEDLLTRIYGPAKDLGAAQSLTAQGVRNGADPARLYVALSNAAQISGNRTLAESALLKALAYQPSFTMVVEVGKFYLQNGKFDRAVSMLRKATEIDSASADAFHLLGVAEERDYQYSAADKAYARAAVLAPREFRKSYAEFRLRMNKAGTRG